jgi:hypothetical protein
LDRMKNSCIVCNMGHSNTEIDVVSLFSVVGSNFSAALSNSHRHLCLLPFRPASALQSLHGSEYVLRWIMSSGQMANVLSSWQRYSQRRLADWHEQYS